MASYRYLRDIKPEDLQPEAAPKLTGRRAFENWWHYHWIAVLAGALGAALAGYFIYSVTLGRAPEPDYRIAIVSPETVSDETAAALETALEARVSDVNGDGRVLVEINQYTADFSADSLTGDAYAQMAAGVRLNSDLEENDSGIFLLRDPASFERYTGALRYLDGSYTEADADGNSPADWYNMVYRWSDCPVLASFSGCSEIGDYYVGFRAALNDKAAAALADDDALWADLTAGAVSTAGEGA